MHQRLNVRTVALLAALATLCLAGRAHAQFTTNPSDLPVIKTPTQGAVQNGPSPDQVRDLLWLRYLQGRSRGRVRTGVPQFVPLGSLGYGNFPGMNGFGANANRQQGSSTGSGQAVGGGVGGAAADPAADPQAQDPQASKRMTVAERRAQAEAAREARRQATRERAQRRLEEAAARAKALAAQPKAGDDPAP